MSAFPDSGRFYPGETPIFRVRFRPEATAQIFALVQGRNALDLITLDRRAIGVIEIVLRESKKKSGTLALAERIL